MACFQRNLFDKTVFHEFVAQAQNERRWKKERGSCSVACFASLTVNKPSQKLKKNHTPVPGFLLESGNTFRFSAT